MSDDSPGLDAGLAWEQDAERRRAGTSDARPRLDVPGGLTARAGRGQVTLDWEPVDGAAGYLVRRSDNPDGGFEPLEIGEPWVRPVPHPPLTDTTGFPGRRGWYTVAAVAAVDDHGQEPSAPVTASPTLDGAAACRIDIDAGVIRGELSRPWRPMIGAERLSQLGEGSGEGGRSIGAEFAQALRLAHDELGVRAVRAHAILHDDVGVYREEDNRPVHDFSGVDRIYDEVLGLGLHPVVEIGFMPHDLARDPSKTVFQYGAIISPPHDWDRWERLVGDLAAHLVERYGLAEVQTWGFEIWNEANLEVFWAGSLDEYLRLYAVSARAIKAVDPALRVGGPATAAVGWIDETFEGLAALGVPIDFVSTHTYGNAPLDLRPIAARHGHPDLPLWWTEWGAHATHFNRAHDSVWAGAYLARGMVSAMGRLDALAYWTVSDHFEELGRGTELLHGGFGLLTVGNLRKPRWWALWMLEQLADQQLELRVEGDGAGDMVNAVATRDERGRIVAVVWNGTVDVTKSSGEPLLDRRVTVSIAGLDETAYTLRHRRLDDEHSNINRVWSAMAAGRPWPNDEEWRDLAAANELDAYEPSREMRPHDGAALVEFDLPMPAVSLIELTPTAAT